MKKELLMGKMLASIIICLTFCSFTIAGMVPKEKTLNNIQGMVQDPLHYSRTYNLGAGQGGSLTRIKDEEYTSFFFNFTVTNESQGFVHLEFFVDYSPALLDQTIINGQSYSGNFTFAGSYEESLTTYMSFNYMVNIGSNVTFIYEEIVWDHYSYMIDTAGYIAIGILSGGFLIIVAIIIFAGRGKKSPQL